MNYIYIYRSVLCHIIKALHHHAQFQVLVKVVTEFTCVTVGIPKWKVEMLFEISVVEIAGAVCTFFFSDIISQHTMYIVLIMSLEVICFLL